MFPHLQRFNLQQWIDENRGNWGQRRVIWQDSDFIAFVTRGPNRRKDYHINPGDEIFYQLEGELNLHYLKDRKRELAVLKAGDLFLMPKNTRTRRGAPMARGLLWSKEPEPKKKSTASSGLAKNAAIIFMHGCALRRSRRCGQQSDRGAESGRELATCKQLR